MFKLRDILRMHFEAHLSRRQIARALSLSRAGVNTTIARAGEAGLTWPLPPEMTDAHLELRLYPTSSTPIGRPPVPLPDWPEVRRALNNKHVTRRMLWEEYRASHADGIGYSQYCDRYRQWLRHVDPSMRIERKAGEKLYVDWSGDPAEFIDPETGEVRQAPLFVAVLGASSYLYAEATRSERLEDWIMAHVRALTAIGAAPRVLVPDNCRTAVTTACYYEPTLNRTYAEMATHYGMAILPARIRKPKDKPTSESGVLIAQRAILGRLRNRQFFSLAQLNEAIAEEIDAINAAPFQKLDGSRQSHFDEIDRPALRPLPRIPYEFAEWLRARAAVNYHIQVEKHFYSVPYRLIRCPVTVRLTSSTLEVFHEEERVASHRRSFRKYGYTTVSEHMPSNHRLYAEWNPERILAWAASAGESVAELCEEIMRLRPHPEQGFRACLGIMRLAKLYDKQRTEAACQRALAARTVSYKSVESILKLGLDRLPLFDAADTAPPDPLPGHEHVRGSGFYN